MTSEAARITIRNMSNHSMRPLTILELTLLGLAAQQPRSGYDFKSIFESTALRQFSSSPGSIYPALKRLETAGFLASRLCESTGDRARRVYEPTRTGRTQLRAWLETDPSADELRQDPRLPILRLSLCGSIDLSPAKAVRFLERLEDAAREYAEEVAEVRRSLAGLSDPYPSLALDQGSASLDALAAWSRGARAEMEPAIT